MTEIDETKHQQQQQFKWPTMTYTTIQHAFCLVVIYCGFCRLRIFAVWLDCITKHTHTHTHSLTVEMRNCVWPIFGVCLPPLRFVDESLSECFFWANSYDFATAVYFNKDEYRIALQQDRNCCPACGNHQIVVSPWTYTSQVYLKLQMDMCSCWILFNQRHCLTLICLPLYILLFLLSLPKPFQFCCSPNGFRWFVISCYFLSFFSTMEQPKVVGFLVFTIVPRPVNQLNNKITTDFKFNW